MAKRSTLPEPEIEEAKAVALWIQDLYKNKMFGGGGNYQLNARGKWEDIWVMVLAKDSKGYFVESLCDIYKWKEGRSDSLRSNWQKKGKLAYKIFSKPKSIYSNFGELYRAGGTKEGTYPVNIKTVPSIIRKTLGL